MVRTCEVPATLAEVVHSDGAAFLIHDRRNGFCTAEGTPILTGVSRHAGISGTVHGSIGHGYHVFSPRECVQGYDPELHEAAMKPMRPHVVAAADIGAAWRRSGRDVR